MAKPAFHGQLKERPFPEVLLEIYRWRLTGTLAVWLEQPRPGLVAQDRITIEEGVPTAALFVEGAANLRDGLLRVMARTRSVFAFYQADLVGTGARVTRGTVDVYALLAESVRRNPRKDAIAKALQSLHRGVIRVRPDADLDAFSFRPEEAEFIKLLRAAPGELRAVLRFVEAPIVAERVLLLLSMVNAIEVELPRAGHVIQSILPPKLQTGILTDEMFGPGVYLSSNLHEGPRNTQPRTRRTSGVSVKKSNSVPPMPGVLSSELQARWDRLVQTALQMDEQDHFQFLGVPSDASEPTIVDAYLTKASAFHPDALPPALTVLRPWAHRVVTRLVEARSVLSDPNSRADYMVEVRKGLGSPAARKREAAAVQSADLLAEAKYHMIQSRWMDALDRIREARGFNHRDGRLLAMEAWCRFNLSPSADAYPDYVALLKQALALTPDLEDAYLYLGLMNERLGRSKAARESFKVLLRINPTHEEAQQRLDALLYDQRNPGRRNVFSIGAKRRKS
ncbi:MAG: DnaJ domain-containing protein [Polyangiales bacterium]|nr:DnaJ domain-containing protein [Myxococcales bacterium]